MHLSVPPSEILVATKPYRPPVNHFHSKPFLNVIVQNVATTTRCPRPYPATIWSIATRWRRRTGFTTSQGSHFPVILNFWAPVCRYKATWSILTNQTLTKNYSILIGCDWRLGFLDQNGAKNFENFKKKNWSLDFQKYYRGLVIIFGNSKFQNFQIANSVGSVNRSRRRYVT